MKARRLGQGKGRVDWYYTQLRDQAWEEETEEQPAQNANIRRRDIVLKVFNMDHVDSSRIGGAVSDVSLRQRAPRTQKLKAESRFSFYGNSWSTQHWRPGSVKVSVMTSLVTD